MDIERDRVITRSNAQYYAYLQQGELRFQRCDDCGYTRHPAREICPECLGEAHTWAQHDGAGTIEALIWYFANAVHGAAAGRWAHPDVLPYNVAIVKLDGDGPNLVTTIADVEFGEVAVGRRVGPVFAELPAGFTSLRFRVSS